MFGRTARCLLACLLSGVALLSAQTTEPELSADEPISADFNTGDLVARGNARFDHPEFVIEADEIRYNQNAGVITATGHVRVTRVGFRLVTRRIQFEVESQYFEADAFRAGTPPLFLEGDSFAGTLYEVEVEAAQLYFREPSALSPSVGLRSATLRPGERIQAEGVELALPLFFDLPLPSIDRPMELPDLNVEGRVGYRSRLGAYLRSEILGPVNEELKVGANFDLYSRRGALLGPSLRFRRRFGEATTDAEISSGWIADQGELGFDVQNEPIEAQRYFADISFHHRQGSAEVVASTTFLSDSEVERDFRPERFESRPHPDSFVEYTQLFDDIFLSLFVERSPNAFYRTLERVPEISLQVPLRPIGETGLLHGFRASFARLRAFGEVEPGVPIEIWEDAFALRSLDSAWTSRGVGTYSLQAPLDLASWARLTPIAQVQWEQWQGDGADAAVRDSSRWASALGFDLNLTARGEWEVENATWHIQGLRHIVRPLVQYRYFSSDETDAGRDYLPAFNTVRPELNLLARRDSLDLQFEHHLVRVGLRNVLQTEAPDGTQRELLELNLYHDWVSEESFDGRSLGGTYLELATAPARWLRLSVEQKIETDNGYLEELRARATIRSAEQWELDFAIDFLDRVYDQYRLDGAYRISLRAHLIGGWRYDARRGELTRQFYGIRRTIGRSWAVEAGLVFRSGAEREDDVSVQASVKLLDF